MFRRASQSMSEAKRKELTSPSTLRPSIEQFDYLDSSSILSPVSPAQGPNDAPSRTIIGLALLFTIIGFTVQIEAIAYFQDVLGWSKPFVSLYLTHSSLALPWLMHLIYLRLQSRLPARTWLRRYTDGLLHSVTSIEAYTDGNFIRAFDLTPTPFGFLLGSMLVVTAVLTVSGVSWFIALEYTTPGDLTAIYNCSAFFAAVFSVPLLKQRIGLTTVLAVALSIFGTFIIAYGDAGPVEEGEKDKIGAHRLFGNLVAAIGAVAFGLYSVIFKRWTDVSHARSASSSFDLAVAASGMTGVYTCLIGWAGVLALHILGIETFDLPSLEVFFWLIVSIIGGAVSMTLLLLLVTWTTPVFGSVTSILGVFFVAIADWLIFGLVPSFATYLGGGLIFIAFGLLARDEAASSS